MVFLFTIYSRMERQNMNKSDIKSCLIDYYNISATILLPQSAAIMEKHIK